MPITYKNRKNRTYYLHLLTTKTGATRYNFASAPGGNSVESIPEGYEIYENPNGLVFLRKEQPKIITDKEVFYVKNGVTNFTKIKCFRVDVKTNKIIVLLTFHETKYVNEALEENERKGEQRLKLFHSLLDYYPKLRFVLTSSEERLYQAQRVVDRETRKDWIDIGKPEKLAHMLRKYLKHLGKESFDSLK